MELIRVMEVVTIVVTMFMFLTGLSPSLNMYKTGDTKNVPFPMFLAQCLSCTAMLHYGLRMSNSTLILVNIVGGSLQVLYVSIYMLVIKPKSKAAGMLFAAAVAMLSFYTYLYKVVDAEASRTDLLGAAGSGITTLIMLMPLVEIYGNIMNKNADGIPPVMLLGGLACASCWLTFGLMLNDPNIYMPNIPGIAIGMAKLYVVQLYSSPKAKAE